MAIGRYAETTAFAVLFRRYTPNIQQTANGDSFSVSLYHDASGTAYTPNKLTSGSSSAFVDGKSSGAIQDATRPCDTSGNVLPDDGHGDVDGDGGSEIPPWEEEPAPGPEPEPEPLPVIPPIVNPPTPLPPGGNDDDVTAEVEIEITAIGDAGEAFVILIAR